MTKTARQIIEAVEATRKVVGDYEAALRALRKGERWEEGCAKDEREPVRVLYGNLLAARGELDALLLVRFALTEVPEDAPGVAAWLRGER